MVKGGNLDCAVVLSREGILNDALRFRDEMVRHKILDLLGDLYLLGCPIRGHILASSNSIHPAVKPENYRAMVDAGREFGAYPLDDGLVAEYRERSYIREISGEEYGRFSHA